MTVHQRAGTGLSCCSFPHCISAFTWPRCSRRHTPTWARSHYSELWGTETHPQGRDSQCNAKLAAVENKLVSYTSNALLRATLNLRVNHRFRWSAVVWWFRPADQTVAGHSLSARSLHLGTFDDLRGLFGEIVYGGHVTHDWNRRIWKSSSSQRWWTGSCTSSTAWKHGLQRLSSGTERNHTCSVLHVQICGLKRVKSVIRAGH